MWQGQASNGTRTKVTPRNVSSLEAGFTGQQDFTDDQPRVEAG
jgi:hypothetical protein